MERIPATERTREKLKALMEGRSVVEDGRSELVRLAARLIIEEALEGEARDALGREYYARGAAPGAGYRNGYRTGRLDSAEGRIEYSAPQIADRAAPFRSAIRELVRGRTAELEALVVEMYARGLSTRDIEGLFAETEGKSLLKNQTCIDEPPSGVLQLPFPLLCDCRQQVVGEIAANRGTDLCDFLSSPAQAVETGQQRSVQARRDRE
jgi:hypothetical protein